MRKLNVSVAGKWFLALTILLGVVAINSGNNVIYLIESMLLSSLILSGILSELSISSVTVNVSRRDCFALQVSQDQILVQNRSRFYLFCIEIGEWKDKKFHSIAFVPMLAPKQKISINSEAVYKNRGIHRWHGLAVATMYPFGFAQKIRVFGEEGQRLIWPSLRVGTPLRTDQIDAQAKRNLTIPEISEGDVREFREGDDPKLIVWTLSALKDRWWVRDRNLKANPLQLFLDLDILTKDKVEEELSILSQLIDGANKRGEPTELTIKNHNSKQKYASAKKALDALAMVQL